VLRLGVRGPRERWARILVSLVFLQAAIIVYELT
jgi:hypothetical protein